MVGRQESLGYCEIVDDSFSLGQQSTLLALVTTSLSDYSARRPSHQLLFDAPFARPRTQGCRRPDITHRCCSCRLTSAQQDSPGHLLPQHHGLPTPYLWRRSPVPQGAPHDLLPDTSDTDVGCPNLKDGDEVDADDLVLHLDQVDDGEDQVLQDLTFRLSGKVLDRGPCTPFDPAPLGLALHEAQGEELVSTPVFITAGLNENKKN